MAKQIPRDARLASLGFLIGRLQYDVPTQDLRIDRARLPALPRDRFVVSGVKLLDAASRPQSAGVQPREQSTHGATH